MPSCQAPAEFYFAPVRPQYSPLTLRQGIMRRLDQSDNLALLMASHLPFTAAASLRGTPSGRSPHARAPPCTVHTAARAARCRQRRRALQGPGAELRLGCQSTSLTVPEWSEPPRRGTVRVSRAAGRCCQPLRAAERRANSATYSLNRG